MLFPLDECKKQVVIKLMRFIEKQAMNAEVHFTIALAGHQNAPFLPKVLENIARQTFTLFEVLCYVEESTDGSLELCRKFARHDSRFQVISAPVSGTVASTRNYAIRHGRGEYLLAVDGDDWVAPDMLEQLMEKLSRTGSVDVLAFAARKMLAFPNGEFHECEKICNFQAEGDEVFSGLEMVMQKSRSHSKHLVNLTWLNLYRMEFLRQHQLYQHEGRIFEDLDWFPRVCFFAQRFAVLDEVLYFYRVRPGSITADFTSSPHFLDVPRQLRDGIAFAMDHWEPQEFWRVWANIWITFLYWILFHPVASRKLSDQTRRAALQILLEKENAKAFRRFLTLVSWPKRLAFPWLKLGALGFLLPSKLYFRWFFYPLSYWRKKHYVQSGS